MARTSEQAAASNVNKLKEHIAALGEEIKEKDELLVEMAQQLYLAHDEWMKAARETRDVEMAYRAGNLHRFLEVAGFERDKTVVEKLAAVIDEEEEGGNTTSLFKR